MSDNYDDLLDGCVLFRNENDKTVWGRILCEQRKIHKLSQKAVAARAGIPFQNYQRFERGERNIRTASFQLACKGLEALEMDIAAFYHGDYMLAEPTFKKDGVEYYKKTGLPVEQDFNDED